MQRQANAKFKMQKSKGEMKAEYVIDEFVRFRANAKFKMQKSKGEMKADRHFSESRRP